MERLRTTDFHFQPFSKKQKQVLTWWVDTSPVHGCEGLIADGAIRSGKTLSMSLSFVMWAMNDFKEQNFGMAGKTIGSFRRNVLVTLKWMLTSRGYQVSDRRGDNLVIISRGKVTNYFYLFGGKDERSQDLIQGVTLAGMFFDEVALMPQSFVNQATGRLSVAGSKMWFNCNPSGPYHYFKTDWIDQKDKKQLLYLHFSMDDNLSLSEAIKQRYRSMYSGVFYDRYILGHWTVAEGIIYDMFDEDRHVQSVQPNPNQPAYLSIDYGTQNATVFLLWQQLAGKWCCVKEYYYSGRTEQRQKTDVEYANDLEQFTAGFRIKKIIIDPSAASFIAEIKKRGFTIKRAKNDVLDGIRLVGSLLNEDKLLFSPACANTLKEFHAYVWDDKAVARGEDKPVKENDHAMDAMRYFAMSVLRKKGGVSVWK
ncbi:MAG: PBSX family phage terminase large subunit [Aerococcus sp.]|nr:PBSX family phage terminase large subunit [Aerococcus sp.]